MMTSNSRFLYLVFCLFYFTYSIEISAKNSNIRNDDLLGLWQTSLLDKGAELIFMISIEPTASDSLKCTIHLPDLGMSNLPYGNFLLQDDSIKLYGLKAIVIDGKIIGRFSAQGPVQDVEFIKVKSKPDLSVSCPERIPEWIFETDGEIWSSPTINNKHLLFGNDQGTFYSVNTVDKSVKWTFKCNDAVRSKALIINNQVAITSDDGFLYLIESNTGKLKWKRNIGNAASPRIKLSKDASIYDYLCSSPIEHDGSIYIGSKDSCIYAISASDGAILWKYKTDNMVRSTATIDGDLLYVGSWDGFMYALRKDDGELVWKFNAGQSIQSSPLVVDDKVIFGSRAASIFALDKKTGSLLWQTKYWMSWVESSPVLYDGAIYIGSSDYRKICEINPSDGTIEMSTHAEGWPWATPAITGELIFNGTLGSPDVREGLYGRFYAIDRSNGNPVWQFKVDNIEDAFVYGFASSPAATKNWVFVGGLDGKMYGFKIQ